MTNQVPEITDLARRIKLYFEGELTPEQTAALARDLRAAGPRLPQQWMPQVRTILSVDMLAQHSAPQIPAGFDARMEAHFAKLSGKKRRRLNPALFAGIAASVAVVIAVVTMLLVPSSASKVQDSPATASVAPITSEQEAAYDEEVSAIKSAVNLTTDYSIAATSADADVSDPETSAEIVSGAINSLGRTISTVKKECKNINTK